MSITQTEVYGDYVYIEAVNSNDEYKLSDIVLEVSTSDKFTSVMKEEGSEYKGAYGFTLFDLEPSTKYYFRIKGKAYDIFDKEYSSVTKFADGNFTTHSRANAVDLGLSVKWADSNLGADHTYDTGTNFYFGTTLGQSYLSSFSSLPANIAGTEYDAATVEYGAPWQLPTKKQWEELFDNCVMEEITERGVKVLKFTSVKNGNYIIMPFGDYWTCDLYTATNEARYVSITSDDISFDYTSRKYSSKYGRAVCR